MIVQQIGYLKLEDVLKLKQFSIYKTHKGTEILIENTNETKIGLYYPKQDRLPWKIIEGKNICSAEKIFDSSIDDLNNIDTKNWNNSNQIMSYREFTIAYLM